MEHSIAWSNETVKKSLPFSLLLLAFSLAPAGIGKAATESAEGDRRQLVAMPPEAQAIMRADMIDHLAALNEVIGDLAEGKLDAAAETAETRIGRSAMGRNMGKARGMGPGRFMPEGMRMLGWNMHDAASAFARVAREGNQAKAYGALQPVTASCVACHLSYRTR